MNQSYDYGNKKFHLTKHHKCWIHLGTAEVQAMHVPVSDGLLLLQILGLFIGLLLGGGGHGHTGQQSQGEPLGAEMQSEEPR